LAQPFAFFPDTGTLNPAFPPPIIKIQPFIPQVLILDLQNRTGRNKIPPPCCLVQRVIRYEKPMSRLFTDQVSCPPAACALPLWHGDVARGREGYALMN